MAAAPSLREGGADRRGQCNGGSEGGGEAGGPVHGVRGRGQEGSKEDTSETEGSAHIRRKGSEGNVSSLLLFLNHRGCPSPPSRSPACLAAQSASGSANTSVLRTRRSRLLSLTPPRAQGLNVGSLSSRGGGGWGLSTGREGLCVRRPCRARTASREKTQPSGCWSSKQVVAVAPTADGNRHSQRTFSVWSQAHHRPVLSCSFSQPCYLPTPSAHPCAGQPHSPRLPLP